MLSYNQRNQNSRRGNELPGAPAVPDAPSETSQGIYRGPGGVESPFGWHLKPTPNCSIAIQIEHWCGARSAATGGLRAVRSPV